MPHASSKAYHRYDPSPVTIDAIADQTSAEGDTISLSISAADATSGTLVFTATGLPNGLSIDPDTGDITGVIAPGTTHHSPLTTTITANDGTYSSSQSLKWAIASPVKITVPADQTNVEGNSVSLTISATDSTSGTITYGAIGLPTGLSINPSTGAITGTVSAGAAASGPYTVTLLRDRRHLHRPGHLPVEDQQPRHHRRRSRPDQRPRRLRLPDNVRH